MRILSFDTSTQALHLCLWQDDKPALAKICYPESANRQEVASLVIPEIDAAISQVGWAKQELDLIVVGQGPGSFTGIRSAVVSARTIAQALRLPLIGVCRLEALAAFACKKAIGGKVAIVLAASAGSYFVAAYEQSGNNLVSVIDPAWANQDELVEQLKNLPSVVADETAQTSLSTCGIACQVMATDENLAFAQAEIAARRFEGQSTQAEKFHWSSVEPLYLRGPSITLKKSYGDSNQTTYAR
jgi:tRNA threonylcarbamoyl adenosine modification protein YeaZ